MKILWNNNQNEVNNKSIINDHYLYVFNYLFKHIIAPCNTDNNQEQIATTVIYTYSDNRQNQ